MSNESGVSVRRRATAQVFVESMNEPELTQDDSHHLVRVRRLRNDERVVASDGCGAWQLWLWRNNTMYEPLGEVEVEPALPFAQVAVPVLSPGRTELAVEKLTELGVSHIAPFISERVQKPPKGERALALMERLQRIAREACAQSRSVHLPTISELQRVDELVSACGATVVLADPDGGVLGNEITTIVVGPEGGFTDAELQLAPAVGLSRHVLRAETAAIAAGVLLTARQRGANDPIS